jgi:large subunit ribosomal protein L29
VKLSAWPRTSCPSSRSSCCGRTDVKANELRDLDDNELTKRLVEMRREVFGLRFSNATGELDDTAGLGRARRDLARALTVARERQLQAGT